MTERRLRVLPMECTDEVTAIVPLNEGQMKVLEDPDARRYVEREVALQLSREWVERVDAALSNQ